MDDRPDAEALARAGWGEADLTWEIIQSTAAETDAAGKSGEAAELWQAGAALAREHFSPDDPRLATSLANLAVARRRGGEPVEDLFEEALAVWRDCDGWVATLQPEVRARSSTFHLRMEAKHPGGYERFSRERYAALVAQGREATEALAERRSDDLDRLTRWRKDCPEGYSDARKLLGAVLLISAG